MSRRINRGRDVQRAITAEFVATAPTIHEEIVNSITQDRDQESQAIKEERELQRFMPVPLATSLFDHHHVPNWGNLNLY